MQQLGIASRLKDSSTRHPEDAIKENSCDFDRTQERFIATVSHWHSVVISQNQGVKS